MYPKQNLFFRPSLNLPGNMAEYLGFDDNSHGNIKGLVAVNPKYSAIAWALRLTFERGSEKKNLLLLLKIKTRAF